MTDGFAFDSHLFFRFDTAKDWADIIHQRRAMSTTESMERDVASGLIILLPLLVTIYVILYLYSILASAAVIPAIDGER